MSEMVSEVEDYLNDRQDIVYAYKTTVGEVSGIEVLELKINKFGTVHQFVTRTDLDEKAVQDFIKRLETELR